MSETDTKSRILDAAEKLIAAQGFAATSLRSITTEAGVNLASVNYHFGSKEELLLAVFKRRIDPINRARLATLDALEAEAGNAPVALEQVVRAFLSPAIRHLSDHAETETLMRLYGRIHAEPIERWAEIFRGLFQETVERFIPALARALPHLSHQELFMRFHFMIGVMAHTMGETRKLQTIMGNMEAVDIDRTEAFIINFVAAGMHAPATAAEGVRT